VCDQFAQTTYPALLAFLLRLVRNRVVAEDLAQTAYEVAFRNKRFDPTRADALGFLKKKASWLVQDYRRRQTRAPKSLPANLLDTGTAQPDQSLALKEAQDRLRRAVARLPTPEHAVVVRHLDGMNHEQIAAELRLPLTVVYRRFHSAKAILRGLLVAETHIL
jgi:RNA polymerase sigma factor (sigma-70 family)